MMRQWAIRKKCKFVLPKDNYKLDNNLLTVEPRAVDPHWIRIQLKILMRIRIQSQIGGGGVGQPKMCIPPGNILGTPLGVVYPYDWRGFVGAKNMFLTVFPRWFLEPSISINLLRTGYYPVSSPW
jgi:hypothetical protein